MNTTFFPNFIRGNYPALSNETNKTLIELGEEFKKYLEKKFEGRMDKLESIWDINPQTVIKNQMNPTSFSTNGYNPILFIHFEHFVRLLSEK